MPSKSKPFATLVHHFKSPHTPHACAYESGPLGAKNAFVFIGGLGDGPHTVRYPQSIAKHLAEKPALDFSVFEFKMKSSYDGWGNSSLVLDAEEISALVKYLRGIGRQKIVLSGHSTGCQDIMEYNSPTHSGKFAPVDGYILQGPACDRAALEMDMGPSGMAESVAAAKAMIDHGKGAEFVSPGKLPDFMQGTPISANRWYALGAADGADNYFDPELPEAVEQKLWQGIDKPILVLHSAEDEFVPKSLDKKALVKRWISHCRPGIANDMCGTIPMANHRVESKEAERWLIKAVEGFLETLLAQRATTSL